MRARAVFDAYIYSLANGFFFIKQELQQKLVNILAQTTNGPFLLRNLAFAQETQKCQWVKRTKVRRRGMRTRHEKAALNSRRRNDYRELLSPPLTEPIAPQTP